nr:EAL domain-containing protein [Candidatus Contendobacter sp.]
NYAFRPYFTEALARGAAFYPALGVTTLQRGLYTSVAILGDKGQPIGALIIKTGLDAIDRILGQYPPYAALLSSDGVVFAANEPTWLFRLARPLDDGARARLRERRQFADMPLDALPGNLDLDSPSLRLAGWRHSVARHPVSIADASGRAWEIITLRQQDRDYPFVWVAGAALLAFGLASSIGRLLQRGAERRRLLADLQTMNAQLTESASRLRETEHTLRQVLDNAPIGIWLQGRDGRMLFVNRWFCEAVGIEESRFTAVPHYAELYPPELAASFMTSDAVALATEGPHVSHERVPFIDGQTHDLEIIKVRLMGSDDHPSGLIGLSTDISARQRAENQLVYDHQFQEVLLYLASEFVNVPMPELDKQISQSLAAIGRFANVDRAYVFKYAFSEGVMRNTHEWVAPGIRPVIDDFQAQPLDDVPDWVREHVAGKTILIPRVDDLPPGSALRRDLAAQEIKTLITLPLMSEGQCFGFVGFDSVRVERSWSEQEVALLGVFAQLLGNAEARACAEERLRKLSLAVEQSPESIIITDLNGNIEYVNQAFVRNTGYSLEEVRGRNPRLLQSGKTPVEVYPAMWATLKAGQVWRGELINQRKDGSEYIEAALLSQVLDEQGKVIGYLAVKQDITDRKQIEARIHRLAFFDTLTGLPNRSLLLDRLARRLGSPRRHHHRDALLLLDVDRFKVINTARGNLLGDVLLRAVGHRLRGLTRASDTVARMAADEFAILLPAVNQGDERSGFHARSVAEKIHAALRAPFECEGETFTVTASIGITLLPARADDTSGDVLRRADTALQRAKTAGGNQSAFFETGMDESSARNYQIERGLREAISGQELRLYLQPQVSAQGALLGAEALLRWQHPSRGLMPPGAFISVAEESSLIVDLGVWVMTEACRILGRANLAGAPLRLSVNVSPRHFRQSDFAPWLRELLAATGADPIHLTLEITEGVFLDNLDEVAAKMNELVALGIHFSIDDFGTGYSSLAYLKRLPIHELKIDKTFVQDAPTDPNDAALVETILAVATHLRLRVVAEGVETEAQAAFLNARGSVIHQGYLYGKPEPAETWLTRWRM